MQDNTHVTMQIRIRRTILRYILAIGVVLLTQVVLGVPLYLFVRTAHSNPPDLVGTVLALCQFSILALWISLSRHTINIRLPIAVAGIVLIDLWYDYYSNTAEDVIICFFSIVATMVLFYSLVDFATFSLRRIRKQVTEAEIARFQFSIKTMLILTAEVALFFGLIRSLNIHIREEDWLEVVWMSVWFAVNSVLVLGIIKTRMHWLFKLPAALLAVGLTTGIFTYLGEWFGVGHISLGENILISEAFAVSLFITLSILRLCGFLQTDRYAALPETVPVEPSVEEPPVPS